MNKKKAKVIKSFETAKREQAGIDNFIVEFILASHDEKSLLKFCPSLKKLLIWRKKNEKELRTAMVALLGGHKEFMKLVREHK